MLYAFVKRSYNYSVMDIQSESATVSHGIFNNHPEKTTGALIAREDEEE